MAISEDTAPDSVAHKECTVPVIDELTFPHPVPVSELKRIAEDVTFTDITLWQKHYLIVRTWNAAIDHYLANPEFGSRFPHRKELTLKHAIPVGHMNDLSALLEFANIPLWKRHLMIARSWNAAIDHYTETS